MGTDNCDVVVVGGGLAGLTAARHLDRAGLAVVVLEARSQIGGRMVSHRLERYPVCVDLGGHWVGPTQDRLLALAEDLGITKVPTPDIGVSTMLWKGTQAAYTGGFPPFDNAQPPANVSSGEWEDARQAWALLEHLKMAWTIGDQPWTAPQAHHWDRQLLSEWIQQHTTTDFGNFVITQMARIGGSGGFEPRDVSLLHMLWTQRVSPQAEHPETWVFPDSAGRIPHLMVAQLSRYSQVLCDALVRSIQQNPLDIMIDSALGQFRARRVVVAMPPCHANRIVYRPAMPDRWRAQADHAVMGKIMKVHAVYPEIFWRDQGQNGTGTGDLETIQYVADSSPPSGVPGILTGFIAGDRADELSSMSVQQRRSLVLRDLGSYFGDQALYPDQYIEKNWLKEPGIQGAFTTHMSPGAWTTWQPVLSPQPMGHIYWAGTEVASRWNGYLDGAVRSGEAAAKAIVESL